MGAIAKKAHLHGGTALLCIAVLLSLSSSASAAAPSLVLRMPQTDEVPGPGAGAGEMFSPRGVAGNPETGHVYVADSFNARVNEYTAWGLFVRAWGWDVAPEGMPGDTPADEFETCGPEQPEATPDPVLCQEGDEGAGKGQLARPNGVAVDDAGSVYVVDRENVRVQKFSPTGEFLSMFGGDVNKTKVEAGAPPAERNECPVDPGDVCQAGSEGEAPSQLAATIGDYIDFSPAEGGTILVGDKGRIQVFETGGAYLKDIPFEGPLGTLAGKTVNSLDVDKDENIYITLNATEDVYKLSSAGAPLSPGEPGASSFEAANPLGVAVDVEGSVYVIDDPGGFSGPPVRVGKFSASGNRLIPTAAEEEAEAPFPERSLGAVLTAVATNICAGSSGPGNVYVSFFNAGGGSHVSYVDAYGTGPIGCEPPPLALPAIGEQFATFVGREDATLRARINPKFWPDASYYVEYGTEPCSAGGCPSKAPLSPALLTENVVNAFVPTAGVILESLAPGVTYHYRFVAQSSGGGPVFGIDPDGEGPLLPDEADGLEATFTTHAVKRSPQACPNDAFRTGPGADLPDCRAYEMVSPLDKGSADVALGDSRNSVPYRLFEVNKSAYSGGRFTFSAATAFGNAQAAPFSSQYLSERDVRGWWSKGISPRRTEAGVAIDSNFGPEFMGFTRDLCRGWLRVFSAAPLAHGAVAKYPNLYRRENCAEPPAYVAITTVEPPTRPPEQYFDLLIKGFSTDGSHTIFTVPEKLHPHAPAPKVGEKVLYEEGPEGLRFVCYLPSGKPSTEACSAGTGVEGGTIDLSPLKNAISDDGSRIFWTAYSGPAGANGSHPGRIYARIDGEETVAVSVPVSPEPAFFWTAANDGSKAIFSFTAGSHKGELYEFDVDAEQERLIAKGVEGPVGASEDASRIYFASTEDLDGGGAASKGAHNLYFYEADSSGGPGDFDFVMALAETDVAPLGLGVSNPPVRPVSVLPVMRAARVAPDGLHATFMSAATPTPTGYDNRDAETGKAAAEVYRYDAVAKELRCVSCNPTGARPAAGDAEGVPAAARIQGWEALNHAPRVISDDGSRVFFESHEALVPEDSNGTWDVYQWEEPGKGTCTTARHTFSTMTGGCVDLISSGQSPSRSLFLDADSSGDNVFFGTQSSLVGADYGLNDVYVARVGGGFPEPAPLSECEGEACQSPPPPPPVRTPASEAFRGPGDKAKRRCPKGKRRVKRKGKVRCVKKRKGKGGKGRKAAGRKGARR